MADHRGKFIGPDKLEVVASFCYLGDMLSAAGGCELSTTTHVKTTWKKFKELLQFFLHATPLSRHVAMCTALVCGVQRSNGAVKTAFHIQDEGKHGPWRPKMTWKQLTDRDCREWKLSAINPHDRNMCEICHACSKPAIWKGAYCCGCCPCMLIKNLIMMMMMI